MMFSLGDAVQYALKRPILGSLGYHHPKLCPIWNIDLNRSLFHKSKSYKKEDKSYNIVMGQDPTKAYVLDRA